MGRSGEVPFFFIRHARANVVNDPTPPHDLLACSRTALARGSVTRGARPGPSRTRGLPWETAVTIAPRLALDARDGVEHAIAAGLPYTPYAHSHASRRIEAHPAPSLLHPSRLARVP